MRATGIIERTGSGSFLQRLRRDTGGNTLAIMAAALVPLAGMIGGGLDASRLYFAKTRLQQACDSGALAGRKAMGGGSWAHNSNYAQGIANQFFRANYENGDFGTEGRTFAYAETAGKVVGTASVDVPMTLMRVLQIPTTTVEVTCQAEMRLPNTDVMFVLDTTGSMNDKAVGTDTQTKIQALKSAVKCFFEIVARLDTTEVCTTGEPSGGISSATQVRFGFMPYATNVNVGKLLPTAYFADTWNYQTRLAKRKPETYTVTNWTDGSRQSNGADTYSNVVYGAWSAVSNKFASSAAACQATADTAINLTGTESGRMNVAGPTISGSTRTTTWTTETAFKRQYNYRATYSSWICKIERAPSTGTVVRHYKQVDNSTTETFTRQVFKEWHYNSHPVDVSRLKNGTNWNASFQWPIGDTAVNAQTIENKTITWDGCIEERQTSPGSTYTSTVGGAAKDLDIDTVPTAGDPSSLWAPALHGLIYVRNSSATDLGDNDVGSFFYDQTFTPANYTKIDGNNQDSYFCPAEAKKLQSWPVASELESYVNGLTPNGNTYHDIGLIWGARFMSPTGIFKADNARTSTGGEIERHLIFMTDGETCTAPYNYSAYGFPWLDRRQQTSKTSAPTYGCETETSTGGQMSEQVNARYAAVCAAVKNQNITLWVIWFGVSKPNLETRLRGCATPSRFYAARNQADLQTTFASIANQISALRLTQ